MVEYLTGSEIIEINRISLVLTKEEKEFHVMQPDDISFILDFVYHDVQDTIMKKALAYCISLIVLHPFKNGNHRTSLVSAERFLIKNNYKMITSNEERIKIEEWRITYEKDHDLERKFFQITCNEDDQKKKKGIMDIIQSTYGKTIEQWLQKNYTPAVL